MAKATLADGRVIKFPDGLPPEQVKVIIQKASAQAAPQAPDGPVMDAAKGLGTGLIEGALGMAAIPAQAGQWLGKKATSGIDYLLGVPPEKTAQRQAETQNFLDNEGMLPNPANLVKMAPQYQPQTTGGKYAKTLGQFLPSTLAGGPVGMGSKLLGATTGAVGSEAAGQLTEGTGAEPYARLVGALAGGVAPAVARRVVTPLPISPERQKMVEALRKEGVDLTAGQVSGRKGLQYAESELGGGKVGNLMEKQGEQFTSAALKRAGITADRATPEVLDQAFTRLGNEFDGLAARNSIPPNAQLATDVAAAVTDYAAVVPASARAPIISKLANDMIAAAQNGLGGKQYQAYRSRLETMARGSKDPQLTSALRDIKESLDDAMERHLAATGSPDLGAWREIRNQYRNIIVLEQAATGAGSVAAQGIISPSHLRNATVSKQGRRNYARGKGEFAELSRAGEATMKPLPQSGTAPRTAARAMGTSVPTLVGAAMGYGAGPMEMIAGGMAGAAVPYAMGRALLSGPVKKYLSNQKMGSQALSLKQRMALSLAGSAPQINYSGGR